MVRRFLLRSFQAVYRFSQRLRRRCTPAGLLVLGGLVAAGVFGIDTQRTLAFQIFALLLSVLGLSIAMTLTFRSRLRIHRLLPEYGTVDQPLNYRVIVENLGKHAQTSLSLIEELETRMPHYDEFIHSPEPILRDEVMDPEARFSGITAEEVIRDTLEAVPVPI